ncbi:MAG: signal peptidase I [Clostridiales bacterium]|jgi:signal peptidase|nr:signal peptidase I [Clostridiales bacterium]
MGENEEEAVKEEISKEETIKEEAAKEDAIKEETVKELKTEVVKEDEKEKEEESAAQEKKPLAIRILSTAVTVLIIGILLITAYMAVFNRDGNGASVGPYRLLTVLTGSMEPTIPVGSLIVTREIGEETIEVDDIITYRPVDDSAVLVTHRVVAVRPEDGLFTTKGDANNQPDRNPVERDAIVGKTVFTIPMLGIMLNFLRTPPGMIAMVVVFVLYVAFDLLFSRLAKRQQTTS